MTLVMGLDVATTTGVARWDTSRHESSIECYTLKAKREKHHPPEQKSWDLGRKVSLDFKEKGRPDFVAIEAPPKTVYPNAPNMNTTLELNRLCGGVISILGAWGIPFEVLSASTWRDLVYGFGKKKGWAPADWKRHAKASAQQMGIDVGNADEAEAAMLAFIAGRKSQYVKMLEREAA